MAKKKKKSMSSVNHQKAKEPVLDLIRDWDKIDISNTSKDSAFIDIEGINEIRLLTNRFVLFISDIVFVRVEKNEHGISCIYTINMSESSFKSKYIDFLSINISLSYPFNSNSENYIHSLATEEEVIAITNQTISILRKITKRIDERKVIFKERELGDAVEKKIKKRVKTTSRSSSVIDINKDIVIYSSKSLVERKRSYNISTLSFSRRGHHRTLRSGKKIWIAPTIINRNDSREIAPKPKIYKCNLETKKNV